MKDNVAKIGMRVGFNALACKTLGIAMGRRGASRRHVHGEIISVDGKNSFGSQVVGVRFDDGEVHYMSPDWLRRVEWSKGGYTHGKRRALT